MVTIVRKLYAFIKQPINSFFMKMMIAFAKKKTKNKKSPKTYYKLEMRFLTCVISNSNDILYALSLFHLIIDKQKYALAKKLTGGLVRPLS